MVRVVEKCERKNSGKFGTLSFPTGIDGSVQHRNAFTAQSMAPLNCGQVTVPTKCAVLNMNE
jgi:hypothetical protein